MKPQLEAPTANLGEPDIRHISPKDVWIYCIIGLLLAPSAVWVGLDHHVWPWDQAWYGEVSVDLWHWFTGSPTAWAHQMIVQMNLKPPAIVWIGQWFVPLRHVLGSVENALLVSILLTELILFFILYRIGERISGSGWIALGGVVFTAGGQCLVGLSTQYMVEPLQGLAVTWMVWIVLRSGDWPLARIVIHLACAVLLGLLAKASTPLYCVVFCLYILFKFVTRPWKWNVRAEWNHWPSRLLILSFAAVLPAAATWYAANLKDVLEHIRFSSSGEDALRYGFRAGVWTKLAAWMGYTWQGFLAPYLLWILIAALAAAVVFAFRSRLQHIPTGAMPLAILCALQMFVVLWVFSLNDAVEPRYLYPIAVNFAVIIVTLCSLIPSRAVGVILLLGCAVQWATVHSYVLGITGSIRSHFGWAHRVHRDPAEYRDLTRIINATTVEEKYNIVGIDLEWLNSNSAAFFAAKHRLDIGIRSYYTSLGYAQDSTAAGLKRLEEFGTRYFITLDEPNQPQPPIFLNVVSVPVLRAVKQDPTWEREVFPNDTGVLLFKRRTAGR